MAKINKTDLINIVSDRAYLSKIDATNAVNEVFDTITELLVDGNDVLISNFGTFNKVKSKPRVGTDPNTHQKVEHQESYKIKFKASNTLKEKIN